MGLAVHATCRILTSGRLWPKPGPRAPFWSEKFHSEEIIPSARILISSTNPSASWALRWKWLVLAGRHGEWWCLPLPCFLRFGIGIHAATGRGTLLYHAGRHCPEFSVTQSAKADAGAGTGSSASSRKWRPGVGQGPAEQKTSTRPQRLYRCLKHHHAQSRIRSGVRWTRWYSLAPEWHAARFFRHVSTGSNLNGATDRRNEPGACNCRAVRTP